MLAPRYSIEEDLPTILHSLANHPRLVLEAPPGAGKTTQVPLALLRSAWCTGKILMLEPRRIAARAAATFMAAQRGEAVGDTIGYRIRFERKVSTQTRIEILTEGVLTRLLQDDPSLTGVSAVIFDEFHERHLTSDLGLALCLDIQAGLRPDLRLVVMSATLDGERLARFLEAPRVTSAGKMYPVAIQHVAPRASETPALQLRRAVSLALDESAGDVLCFLPGKAEIERAARMLRDLDVAIATLHGDLSVDEQARILQRDSTRRLTLSTNVAESSVTLPNVTAVVDSGLAREPRFDPASGMSRLATVPITRSSATQRAGRAGRLAAGKCYRLWPESQRLDPATRPELQYLELSTFVLELKVWGSDSLRFLDPPPAGAMAQARTLLRNLDAIDAHDRPTPHGRRLLELGVHPRLGNAMLCAPPHLQGLACDLGAVLEARERRSDAPHDDLRARIAALRDFRLHRALEPQVSRGALVTLDQAAQTWRRRVGVRTSIAAIDQTHAVGDVL
ncbi:MAG: ATP-dependent helicase HrpB, partial [Gammaproteobacteria bacterium]